MSIGYDLGVKPLELIALEDNRVLLADASRRIYLLDQQNPKPLLWGCLPHFADPTTSIGTTAVGTELVTVTSRPSLSASIKGKDVYRTELRRTRLDDGTFAKPDVVRIESDLRYQAVTYSPSKKVLFLVPASATEIQRADLIRVKNGREKEITPTPVPWITLPGATSITELLYSDTSSTLIALDGASGTIHAVRDDTQQPRVDQLADFSNSLVGLAIDAHRDRLYVGDPVQKGVWRLDCPGMTHCGEPIPIAHGQIALPSILEIAPNGTLWIGDPEDELIKAISPEGEILQVIREVPTE